MRVVTLEEHFSLLMPGVTNPAMPSPGAGMPGVVAAAADKMTDISTGRIGDMDRNGITVQVLSKAGVHITPSADQFDGKEAIAFAQKFNDGFAKKIAERPERFAAFAHLAASIPEAAADELERTVTYFGFKGTLISGTIRGAFLDDPKFAPLLARAEKLDVPIYIHPGMPPAEVRKAYYEGFPNNISFGLATFAWGWHYEVALHVMRLAVSGTMDKYPKLNFIIGHMGEGLPAMLARCEHQFGKELSFLSRPLGKTITDQVYVTSAGFFTNPPFVAALETFGIDRLMFSVDYPYASNADGRAFLEKVPLSPADRAKFAHGNADRLLKLNA
ncbi:MAG TPA: amidohydrolase family protein [Xanthobacteraceae bacterium]|nr:amidohydrolase family protein [Xanthobacteraceae bacterium]